MIITPAKSIRGVVSVPGDKSISHRAVILTSIADGESHIGNFATGVDCSSTIRCIRQLGVEIEQNRTSVTVHGVGKTGLHRPSEPLDCGNSGTTMRLLAGLLSGQAFVSVLTGDESLKKRPMGRIIGPLGQMGAEIDSIDGFAPLTIDGRCSLTSIRYETPVASAQLKSCLILAGLFAEGTTTVIEKSQSRDHTERMLRWLGAALKTSTSSDNSNAIEVDGASGLNARDITVPGDISSAAFFIVAGACLTGSDIDLRNVGINGSRAFLLEKLHSLGVPIKVDRDSENYFEPVAEIQVGGNDELSPNNGCNLISGNETARMIDEIPILAILGSQLKGGLEVRDAKELRIKETDRIAAICENLRRMNASVEEFDDGFRVQKSQLKGGEVNSFGDHRIAMAFTVAGLLADGETMIIDPECADISFPGFYDSLESVVQR